MLLSCSLLNLKAFMYFFLETGTKKMSIFHEHKDILKMSTDRCGDFCFISDACG